MKIGDIADLSIWDKYERPVNRLGPCEIIAIESGQWCESGVMVTLRIRSGGTVRLDSHWLRILEQELDLFGTKK